MFWNVWVSAPEGLKTYKQKSAKQFSTFNSGAESLYRTSKGGSQTAARLVLVCTYDGYHCIIFYYKTNLCKTIFELTFGFC